MKNRLAFGEILKKYREERGQSQSDIAKVLDVSPQMVSKLENEKSLPTAQTLKTLSAHFHVSIEALLGIDKPVEATPVPKILPVLGKISAGLPLLAEEQRIGQFPVLPGVEGDFLLLVWGDSMEPAILDGGYVVVKQGATVQSGSIGVVRVDASDALVKRLYFDPNGVILKSDNPAYPPIFIEKQRWASLCQVIGKVTMILNKPEV